MLTLSKNNKVLLSILNLRSLFYIFTVEEFGNSRIHQSPIFLFYRKISSWWDNTGRIHILIFLVGTLWPIQKHLVYDSYDFFREVFGDAPSKILKLRRKKLGASILTVGLILLLPFSRFFIFWSYKI